MLLYRGIWTGFLLLFRHRKKVHNLFALQARFHRLYYKYKQMFDNCSGKRVMKCRGQFCTVT